MLKDVFYKIFKKNFAGGAADPSAHLLDTPLTGSISWMVRHNFDTLLLLAQRHRSFFCILNEDPTYDKRRDRNCTGVYCFFNSSHCIINRSLNFFYNRLKIILKRLDSNFYLRDFFIFQFISSSILNETNIIYWCTKNDVV